jgi:phthalate 4,5-dioxygenase
MLTQEDNDLLTRIGPGTPGGDFMRRYWQPVAMAEELPAGGAPLPVRLLGEDLVLFRDEQGRPGLLGLHCAHRGADLSYGRLEDGGLRCLYHGWLYNVEGRCLDQPGEPAGSTFKDRIRQKAYPCQEAGGLILAYLGPGEPPLLPGYAFLSAPDEHRLVVKYYQECSYLQANEGNWDPAHLSFLHRQLTARTTDDRVVPGSTDVVYSLLRQDTAPVIEPEETDFGVRILAVRKLGPDRLYVRITNFLLPDATAVVAGPAGTQEGHVVQWHVPIDDTHHWRYDITYRRTGPLDKQRLLHEYHQDVHVEAGHRPLRTQANRYLQNREEMRCTTYSGLGPRFPLQDSYATETQGPIQDRTSEHLGATDQAIILARRVMLRAIREVQAGNDPPHVVRDPDANQFPHCTVMSEVVPSTTDWRNYWKTRVNNGGVRV